jgi:hypothetical protein
MIHDTSLFVLKSKPKRTATGARASLMPQQPKKFLKLGKSAVRIGRMWMPAKQIPDALKQVRSAGILPEQLRSAPLFLEGHGHGPALARAVHALLVQPPDDRLPTE